MNKTPILLITYNRPEHLNKVLSHLSNTDNPIYIFQDGAKNKTDLSQNLKVKKIISANNNKFKKIKILNKNLGCKRGVEEAINWIFQYEDSAIILEDDIIIHHSFLNFATNLLDTYKNDSRVFMISATKQVNSNETKYDYFFSKHTSVWGWATWKNKWDKYNFTKKYLQNNNITNLDLNIPLPILKNALDAINDKVDTWDFIWEATLFLNSAYCIIPQKNLATNIGFDSVATHTKIKTSLSNLKINPFLKEEIIHPPFIAESTSYEKNLIKSRNRVYLLIDIIKNILKHE